MPVVIAISALAAGSTIGSNDNPTKGTIEGAINEDGQIDPNLAPDFIIALGRDGDRVGYVTKAAALELGPVTADASGRPVDLPIPVFAEDLETIVGHFYPARGFVPLGTDPDAVPTIEIQAGPAAPNAK